MNTFHLRQLTIIGVGLIGGSLARALREAGAADHICGCGRDEDHLQRARQLGVIDHYTTDIAAAARDADMIVVAVPLAAMEGVFRELAGALADDAVITDVGSAKGMVVTAARRALGGRFGAFVPGHPIAGTEKSGVEASFAGLFREHSVILTPLAETDAAALARVRAMWQTVGARLVETDCDHHDEVLAATSHLPHLLAFALVDTLAQLDDSEAIFRFAAGGFRDFSRIASSDPVMWRDICTGNRDAIIRVLQKYIGELQALQALLAAADGAALKALFTHAKQVRDRHINDGLTGEE